jgi:hypothetical protein
MSHFTTSNPIGLSAAAAASAYTTILNLENGTTSTTLSFENITTTIQPEHHGPPSSPYSFTQMILIGIVFIILSILTVIGNVMVNINIFVWLNE